MNKKFACLALGLTIISAGASAQGLHKEINVDQKIDPIKRDASRINILPSLQLPALSNSQLPFSDRVVTSRLSDSSPTLAPLAFGDKLSISPYRGYVSLGLGTPKFIADFSAGYRIIDSERSHLNIWSQYCGDIYSSTNLDGNGNTTWNDHSATIGLDLHQKIRQNAALTAGLNYEFGHHTVPYLGSDHFGQNTSRVNADMAFSSKNSGLDFDAAIRYRHFGFYHLSDSESLRQDFESKVTGKTVRQNLFGATLGASLPFSENSALNLDIDADFLCTGLHDRPTYPYSSIENLAISDSETTGIFAITPYYSLQSSTVSATIGAKLNISTGNDKTFHFAPEVAFAWTPSQVFGFEAKLKGGSYINPVSELYDVSPYLSPYMAYRPSHIPYALDARMSVGPFFGAYLEIFGGYAKASNWLMPVYSESYPGYGIFENTTLTAWHAGAAIGYDYRDVFSVRASYETAPNDYDHSLYEWRDRARHVFNAQLGVRPFKPLSVTLGWEFRAGRRIYGFAPSNPSGLFDVYIPEATSLGCVSDLSLGATYTFTEQFSVFARGGNLLNRRYRYIGMRTSQGINGMIGASLKF